MPAYPGSSRRKPCRSRLCAASWLPHNVPSDTSECITPSGRQGFTHTPACRHASLWAKALRCGPTPPNGHKGDGAFRRLPSLPFSAHRARFSIGESARIVIGHVDNPATGQVANSLEERDARLFGQLGPRGRGPEHANPVEPPSAGARSEFLVRVGDCFARSAPSQ